MASLASRKIDQIEVEGQDGRVVMRRITDECTGTTPLERSIIQTQVDSDEEDELQDQSQLKLLFERPESSISYGEPRQHRAMNTDTV
jgi:hypothetical protein